MKKKTDLEYACMELGKYKRKRRNHDLSDAFLRQPYQHTKAECSCDQLVRMHEFDWMK